MGVTEQHLNKTARKLRFLNNSIGVTEQNLNETSGKSLFLNKSIGVTEHFCHAPPMPDASQILSQAPCQKSNDFFHEVITNPSLFAHIQPGSILTHPQVDFQEHSKVPE